jgi:hypothetical protein
MTVELLLISIAGGITLLAYLIAINAQGPFRLSVSYLMATLMLAGTVWIVIQYVNEGVEVKKNNELAKIEMLRKIDEQSIKQQADSILLQGKLHAGIASKMILIISNASNYANLILNADLQSKTMDFETLMDKASETKKKVDDISAQYAHMDSIQMLFPDSYLLIKDGIGCLSEAAANYKNYYFSEDSSQESQREKVLRMRAKVALEKFNKAGMLLSK